MWKKCGKLLENIVNCNKMIIKSCKKICETDLKFYHYIEMAMKENFHPIKLTPLTPHFCKKSCIFPPLILHYRSTNRITPHQQNLIKTFAKPCHYSILPHFYSTLLHQKSIIFKNHSTHFHSTSNQQILIFKNHKILHKHLKILHLFII